MIIVLVLITTGIVLFMGFYMISFNFMLGNFNSLYDDLFQSDVINRQNFELTEIYMKHYNQWWWNLYCYDDLGNYEDNDCKFRSSYGFIQPNQKIDTGFFSVIKAWELIVSLTWDVVTNWVKFSLKNLNTNKTITDIVNTNYTFPIDDLWDYTLEIENLWDWWGQYFAYLSGSEWMKYMEIDNEWLARVKQLYNITKGKDKLLNSDIEYSSTLSVALWDLLNFLWLDPNFISKSSRVHFNAWGSNMLWVFVNTSNTYIWTWENIYVNSGVDLRVCDKTMNWYYWNELKWDIVYPLDNDTLSSLKSTDPSYNDLYLTGAFYTNCIGYPDNIYGQIDYYQDLWWGTYSDLFTLQAGRVYDFTGNSITSSEELKENFWYELYNWLGIPIWLIYDTNGWIWFVWWIFSLSDTMKDFIDYTNSTYTVSDLVDIIDSKAVIFATPMTGSALRYIDDASISP